MDRRKFFSMLGKTAGAGVSLTALQKIVPEAQATEVRPNRQYVFTLKRRVTDEAREMIARGLHRCGVNAVVIDFDVDIFEVNG